MLVIFLCPQKNFWPKKTKVQLEFLQTAAFFNFHGILWDPIRKNPPAHLVRDKKVSPKMNPHNSQSVK